jgi:hypothetical protein
MLTRPLAVAGHFELEGFQFPGGREAITIAVNDARAYIRTSTGN